MQNQHTTGGRDRQGLFRIVGDNNRDCDDIQVIKDLQETDIFPRYTSADCITLIDNHYIDQIPIFPNTVKSIELGEMDNLKKLLENQFPDDLTELHIDNLRNLTEIHLPQKLQRLTVEGATSFEVFRKSLPNSLVVLKLKGTPNFNLEYNDLPNNLMILEFNHCTFSNKSNIMSILLEYQENNPQCGIVFDNEQIIPTKSFDLNENTKAYDFMELEEFKIIEFLADRKHNLFIVGKCFNELIFIDRRQLLKEKKEGNEWNDDYGQYEHHQGFPMNKIGFAMNNAYINVNHIHHILISRHKFWLFEKINKHHSESNESSEFTLVKLDITIKSGGKGTHKNKNKRKRKNCRKGTHRNKNSGLCEKNDSPEIKIKKCHRKSKKRGKETNIRYLNKNEKK
jgi:hypothetical protein